MISEAVFSKDKRYRYQLKRIWNTCLPQILFVGLNPSIADSEQDDPTTKRLIGFAKRWGYGGFTLCNLYAYCTPSPKKLFAVPNPIGNENDQWIKKSIKGNDRMVLIYGNHGQKHHRDKAVLNLIKAPYCIELSKLKMPKHPLYLSYTSAPIPFTEQVSQNQDNVLKQPAALR